jgi:hypothetical protein
VREVAARQDQVEVLPPTLTPHSEQHAESDNLRVSAVS